MRARARATTRAGAHAGSPSRSEAAGARRPRRRYSGPSRRSIFPRSTISQQCSNIRTLRRYSLSLVGVGFSNACARGSYTARRPRCTIRYGSDRSWPNRGIDLDVVGASHCIDRAVPACDRAEGRLRRAHAHLVAPVEPFLVRALRLEDPQLAADVGDVRIGECAHQFAQRVGRPRRVGVRERDDLGVGLAHGAVLCGDLATARVRDHPDARKLQRDLLRTVARRIGGDDDLAASARVVECEQVLESARDHRLLVVGGDDHGDRRLDVRRADAPRRDPREAGRRGRVEHVGPGERGERDPEDDVQGEHGADSTRAIRRSSARRYTASRRSAEAASPKLASASARPAAPSRRRLSGSPSSRTIASRRFAELDQLGALAQVREPARAGGDHGPAVRHRLAGGEAVALTTRRHAHDGGPRVVRAELGRWHEADRLRNARTQRAVAGDHPRQAFTGVEELEDSLLLAQPARVENVRRLVGIADRSGESRCRAARPRPPAHRARAPRRRDTVEAASTSRAPRTSGRTTAGARWASATSVPQTWRTTACRSRAPPEPTGSSARARGRHPSPRGAPPASTHPETPGRKPAAREPRGGSVRCRHRRRSRSAGTSRERRRPRRRRAPAPPRRRRGRSAQQRRLHRAGTTSSGRTRASPYSVPRDRAAAP